MLSAGLQRSHTDFGPQHRLSLSQSPSQTLYDDNSLDALAEGYSPYEMQQVQHHRNSHSLNGVKPSIKHRHSYSTSSLENRSHGQRDAPAGVSGGDRTANGNGQPVRRRISRACDQCNQLRTKCDGKNPCAHCVELGLSCEYARERKKRGKASRKELAAQQAASSTNGGEISPKSANYHSSEDGLVDSKSEAGQGLKRKRSSSRFPAPRLSSARANSNGSAVHHLSNLENGSGLTSNNSIGDAGMQNQMHQRHRSGVGLPTPRISNGANQDRGIPVSMGDYNSIDDYHRSVLHPAAAVTGPNILHSSPSAMPNSMIHGGSINGYADNPYAIPSPNSQGGVPPFRMGESPLSAGFLGQSPVAGSPAWLPLPSPSGALYSNVHYNTLTQSLRYPVLRPLLPHISAIIPIGLACDLLELYFSSTSSVFMQPQSPYILGYVFRKRSFLRQNNPRPCSPALLASMLWVAAQTSESAFLTSQPSARGKICQKLLELTVTLLKPLIHTSNAGSALYGANTVINGVALGGFGVALHGPAQEMEGGSPGGTGALDDVATYIHLATVVSASEYKAASLRWWNVAWTLARELKLGREMPPHPESQNPDGPEPEGEVNAEAGDGHPGSREGPVSEEEREERRRTWWLLYIVDRHLALCYNRPLFLLDIECDSLLQPENDTVWQAGEYYTADSAASESSYYRRRGPNFECTGHSIFGYFLPLMTILGEIVDLNHARNHPRFGLRFRSGSEWDDQATEISQQLEAYGRSLTDFEARNTAPSEPKGAAEGVKGGDGSLLGNTSPHSVGTTSTQARMTEAMLQTKIVVAYGTHLMHTLHILLNGKWDPISLLDDNDLWISSQSFISATGHAVSAAEAINEILEYDPDLSFMPFFFGIYLLQGSFLLLLIADKLQGEASPSVVKACETIVRAHEACVVTLNTEYQVCISSLVYPSSCTNGLTCGKTEKFPQSHALRPVAGSRTSRRGLR